MLKLNCKCGNEFKRPKVFMEYKDVIFKWKLEFCDECFEKRVEQALKRLPEIIEILADAEYNGK